MPHRRNTMASKRFLGLVDARVPPKRNSGEKETHQDFHYTSCQVSMVNQLAEMFSDNTLALSADNKNKVEIANPAVSRRCQLNRFYLKKDAPNYSDHDYPYRNSKIVPGGYQNRRSKITRSRSLSPTCRYHTNKRKRSFSESDTSCIFVKEKINWPRSGPLHVQVYPSRIIESTSVMHVNFLKKVIKKLKNEQRVHNLVAVADGGPDWSVKGALNLMVFGMFWEVQKLDVLVVQCFAPGHSRFNPIERSWSFLTKCIVGVNLPVKIPELNYIIPKEKEHDKWNVVLDNAVQELCKFWHNKCYDVNCHINAHKFLSSDPDVGLIKNVHKIISKFVRSSKKAIQDDPEMCYFAEKYRFLIQHCRRKPYQLEFLRCFDGSCKHCTYLPKRDNEFLNVINRFGGTLPTPVMSDVHQGHYTTLEDQFRLSTSRLFTPSNPSDMPFFNGVCEFGTCQYTFF